MYMSHWQSLVVGYWAKASLKQFKQTTFTSGKRKSTSTIRAWCTLNKLKVIDIWLQHAFAYSLNVFGASTETLP